MSDPYPRSGTRVLAKAAVVTAMFAPLLFVARPAPAIQGDKITYEAHEGSRLEKRYGLPLATTDGGSLITPDDCNLSPSCVHIPMEIIAPEDRGPLEDWTITLTVSWTGENVDTGVAGEANPNDLDIYLYRPTTDAAGEPTYEEVTRSATFVNPEVIKLYRPSLRNYDLTVVNFSGIKDHFTVTIEFQDATFTVPDFPAGAPFGPTPSTETTLPQRSSAPRTSLAIGPSSAPPSNLLEPIEVGDDFTVGRRDDFEDLLSGPVRHTLFEQEALAKPEPVSGSTVAIWMTLVPLGLLAAAGTALYRFRPAVLSSQLWRLAPPIGGTASKVRRRGESKSRT